jgi:MinD superfamily P-loop ATPase
MIRLAVVSGKGGTGKTVITSALSQMLPNYYLLADCDVDAANLGLLLAPKRIHREPFHCMNTAVIDPDLCTLCGKCSEFCRFRAVDHNKEGFSISNIRCEGCGVCAFVCPEGAISFTSRIAGEIFLSDSTAGPLVDAMLVPGAGNSGLLVHEVKKIALAQDRKWNIFLVDGPPGIGCPLISTLTGVDAVLIVTEPSISGLHDLKRVVKVVMNYTTQISIVINRYDIDEPMTELISEWCSDKGFPLIGKIPFDPWIIDSVRNCRPITRFDTAPGAQAIQEMADVLYRSVGVK